MFVGGLTEGFRSGKVCTIVSADLELKLVEVIMHQCVGFHIHNFLDGMLVFCETMFIENIVEAFGVVEEPIVPYALKYLDGVFKLVIYNNCELS